MANVSTLAYAYKHACDMGSAQSMMLFTLQANASNIQEGAHPGLQARVARECRASSDARAMTAPLKGA